MADITPEQARVDELQEVIRGYLLKTTHERDLRGASLCSWALASRLREHFTITRKVGE